MSDAMNSHATAIIERCKAGDIWGADLFTVADHAKALAAELVEANARVNALSEARARRFAEAVEVESERERRTMDSTTDHAARISARIEEYKTLDLIGRNSADDLQHHLRALAAELAEAKARIARLIPLARHHRAIYGNAMSPEEAEWARAVIAHGDLDAAPGDPAGER